MSVSCAYILVHGNRVAVFVKVMWYLVISISLSVVVRKGWSGGVCLLDLPVLSSAQLVLLVVARSP